MTVRFEDGRAYKVYWAYSREEVLSSKGRVQNHRRNTVCYITCEAGPDEGDTFVGDALLHWRDKFSPEKGRKVSLAAALRDAGFHKVDREVFWLQVLQGRKQKLTVFPEVPGKRVWRKEVSMPLNSLLDTDPFLCYNTKGEKSHDE